MIKFCWLGIHKWKVKGSHISRDMSFGEPGWKNTCVHCNCENCGKHKSYYIDGVWDIKEK